MTDNPDGCFIVFEGIDGAGTTTQCARYADYLRARKRLVHLTREPSDGPIGTMLRLGMSGRMQLGAGHQPHCMALLFAADRLDHVDHEIQPHLRDGGVVISDRYDLSSIAYQSATARTDQQTFEAWVKTLNEHAIRPLVTVILDVDPDVAEQRRRVRSRAPDLYEESQLQSKLAALYRDASRLLPNDRFVTIDGNQSADDVEQAVRVALAPLIEPNAPV